jgi:glycosyltransferase involved in cell wall biosynthesis
MIAMPIPLVGQDLLPATAIFGPVAVLIVGSALFWVWGILKWRRNSGRNSMDLPSVTVLIAGRNEELYIRTVLESILKCDYPQDKFAVFFVDDHSNDQTCGIASEIAVQFRGRLHVLTAPPVPDGRSPKKSALAFGIQQTGGDILLFTDADSEVRPGWIESMVRAYDQDTGAVAGATVPDTGHGLHQRFYRLERFMTAFTSASAIGHGSPASVTGQNFSFRRSAFEDVGGYAYPGVASGDDDLMAQAFARRGWTVKFCAEPESVVTDLRPPEPRSHLAAASRHQSTIRFYPLGWRMAYLFTILAGWSVLVGGVFSLFHREYLTVAALVVALKLLIDGFGVRIFARRLRIRLSLVEFLLTQTMLPPYLIVRPMLTFRSSFDWRGRTHKTMQHPATDFVP